MSDKNRFAEHASPDAIIAQLGMAETRLRDAQAEVAWLKNLLTCRRGQIVRGEWPRQRKEAS